MSAVVRLSDSEGGKRSLAQVENVMPGAGPILLFDKSLLQSLSIDEAVWLDTFYFPCITPLFFVETLADLKKEVQKGGSPEEVVGNLAEKTPIGGGINVHHRTLCVNELLGRGFELRHVPVVSGGKPVTTGDGRRAVVFDPPPETVALERHPLRIAQGRPTLNREGEKF